MCRLCLFGFFPVGYNLNLNHFSRQIEDNESFYACLANFMNLVHKNKVVT